jgi:hypothetical protein
MPFKQPVACKPFREYLKPKMPNHIQQKRIDRKYYQRYRMIWHNEGNNRNNTHFDNRLYRMKSISSERSGVDRKMVRFMRNPEQWLPVHQPVRPVKISIMQEDHQDDTEKQVEIAIVMNIVIHPGIALLACYNGKNDDYAEDQYTQHGVTDLSQDMLVFRIPLLDFCIPEFVVLPDIEYEVKYTG